MLVCVTRNIPCRIFIATDKLLGVRQSDLNFIFEALLVFSHADCRSSPPQPSLTIRQILGSFRKRVFKKLDNQAKFEHQIHCLTLYLQTLRGSHIELFISLHFH